LLTRLLWPWIAACTLACAPFVSWRQRLVLQRQLQAAGLDVDLQPEHIVGLQLFLACLTLGLGFLLRLFVMPGVSIPILLIPLAIAITWPRFWLRQRSKQRQQQMLREFPFFLDMTTLCVEAGLNLQGALMQASQHGPQGPLRQELRHAL